MEEIEKIDISKRIASAKPIHHKGRVRQVPIYLGKLFRMLIFQDDWKVLPMSALIAGLVAYVVGGNMFKTMEGTMMGSLALSCICIWNGFFNSIQVVCREREIVKREHRSGMHISSYIVAHMIYQATICLLQTVITLTVCKYAGMAFPTEGTVTPWFLVDFGITVFLLTYAADMMSLLISCFARTTTVAMTLMPFMLIFELVFSGAMFSLSGFATKLCNLSLAKWGITCFCAQSDYNSLGMVTVWNQLVKFRDFEFMGQKPIDQIVTYCWNNDLVDSICLWFGQNSQNQTYVKTIANIGDCWLNLVIFIGVFALLSIACLERIDKDKR